ncbi:MAG: hypothetical protein SGBAC_007789, partial [Bacillariaceae sp.]
TDGMPPPPPPPPPPRANVGQFRPPPPPSAQRGPTNRRQPPSTAYQMLNQQQRQAQSGISMPPPPPPSSAPANFSSHNNNGMGQPRFAPPPPTSRSHQTQFNPLPPPTATAPPQPQPTAMYPGGASSNDTGFQQGGPSFPPRSMPPTMVPPLAPPNYGGGMGTMPPMNNSKSRGPPPPPMANAAYSTPPGPPAPPAYNNTNVNGYGQQQQQHQQQHSSAPPNGYGHAPPPPMNQAGTPPMNQATGIPPPQPGYPSPQQYGGGGGGRDEPTMDIPEIPVPTMPHGIIREAYYPKATLLSDATPVQPPPPANSRFIVLDDGNASPHLLRSTLYAIPRERSVLQKVLGSSAGNSTTYQNDKVDLLATPLAVPSAKTPTFQTQLPEELRLTQVAVDGSTDKTKPPRCHYCNSYVNPFWSASKCNFCNRPTSKSYQNSLASILGTVEYPVAGPYITKSAPVQPVFLYAIDATTPSCQKYVQLLMDQVFPTILEHAEFEQQNITTNEKPKVRVGIVFCLASGVYIPTGLMGGDDSKEDDKMGFTVMPDVQEDPYSPLPLEEWTYDVMTQFEALQSMCSTLLETLLPRLIQERVRVHSTIGNSKDQPIYQLSVGGAAMAFLVDALKETGGRATWISWRRPNCGVGKLMDRERSKLVKPAHKPVTDPFYKDLTAKCQDYKVSMDIVLHSNPAVPNTFLDVSTLGQVCAGSNGNLIRIAAPTWRQTFVQELVHRITSPSGWDCVFKVRCSTGLRVHSLVTNDLGKYVMGSGITDDSPDLELPVVQADTCLGFKLEHRVGGIPKSRSFVYIQTALLYTNAWTGERKVRVSTLGLRTCQTADQAFPSFDFGTLAACELRRAAQNSLQHEQDLKSTRGLVQDRLVAILADYRKTTSQQQMLHSNQLVLPEKLRLYPTFVMALLKSPLLREAASRRSQLPNPTADERAHFVQEARRVTPSMAFHMVHPLLFQVPEDNDAMGMYGTLNKSDGTLLSQLRHSPFVPLEGALRPTISCLEDDQIYLMDTGLVLYVVIERQVPRERLKELSANEGPLGRMIGQLRNFSHVGTTANLTATTTTKLRRRPPVIYIHAEKDKPLYHDMLKWMVEDASASEPDRRGFYKRLHSKIKENL